MSRLPMLSAKQVIRALERAGFRIDRQTGSHARYVHVGDPSRYATVSMHVGDISRQNLTSILRQSRLSVAEFLKLLK